MPALTTSTAPDPPPALAPGLRDAILSWYGAVGRPLAFRATGDPWAILVSEAMAQQTQAVRAAEHWTRFLAQFPTARALADTTPAATLRAWRGLGYNRRALALRAAAIANVRDHDGFVPDDLEALRRLPGVGPDTARAVAALAFGRPVGAVDVNVRRVHARVLAGSRDALGASELQANADAAVPVDRGSVEPLLRRLTRVRQRQQADPLHLRRLLELDQPLGLRPPPETPRAPRLLLRLPLLVDRDDPLRVLGGRPPALVHLVHDGAAVLGLGRRGKRYGEHDDETQGTSYSNSSASAGDTERARRAG
jgi:endonuclease III